MKKVYILVILAFLGTGSVMAQYPQSWGFWQSEMAGDWRANLAAMSKKEYKIWVAPADWDAATSNVMDVWNKIPVGYALDKFFAGDRLRNPSSSTDFAGSVKYMYDADNLYVLFKATDDYIFPADSSTQESFEVMWAPYPDSIPMAMAKQLDPLFAADPTSADARQSVGYWTKAGAIKTSLDAKGNNSYLDYTAAWDANATINWSAPIANLGVVTKFTKLTATEYTYMVTIPFGEAMSNFVPSADTAIAIELKVVDKDTGKKNIEAASNTDQNDLWVLMYYAGRGKFSNDVAGGNVGISQSPSSKISVYPNPATDEIRISNSEQVKKVVITNLIGQSVRTFEKVSNNSLNLDKLGKGVYLVRLYGTNNSITTQKIIVK